MNDRKTNLKGFKEFATHLSIHEVGPTDIEKMPPEIFGTILTFLSIEYIPKLASLNKAMNEHFSDENSILYKIIIQKYLQKDEQYMRDIIEKQGLSYRRSLKQIIKNNNNPRGVGTYVFETQQPKHYFGFCRLDPKKTELSQRDQFSLNNFTMEMWFEHKGISIPILMSVMDKMHALGLGVTFANGYCSLFVGNPSHIIEGSYLYLGNYSSWSHVYMSVSTVGRNVNISLGVDGSASTVTIRKDELPFKDDDDYELVFWSNFMRKPIYGSFTEIRVWNRCLSAMEIESGDAKYKRLTPFLKSAAYKGLLYYFYPDVEDINARQVSNKSPIEKFRTATNSSLTVKRIDIAKYGVQKSISLFDDVCSIL